MTELVRQRKRVLLKSYLFMFAFVGCWFVGAGTGSALWILPVIACYCGAMACKTRVFKLDTRMIKALGNDAEEYY